MEDKENIWLKFGQGQKQAGQWIREHVYPIIIGLSSLLVLVFVPMIGSRADIDSIIPTDPKEAFLFWTLKGLTVALNLAIFSAFRSQAKYDIKDHPKYLQALELLARNKPKGYKPMSPAKFAAKQWGTKGTTLALSTAVTSIALTNIILYYDWVTGVSCLVTIIIAIIFGLMNMSSEEIYWTEDYLQYAKLIDSQKKEEEVNKIVTESKELCETQGKQCFQDDIKEN